MADKWVFIWPPASGPRPQGKEPPSRPLFELLFSRTTVVGRFLPVALNDQVEVLPLPLDPGRHEGHSHRAELRGLRRGGPGLSRSRPALGPRRARLRLLRLRFLDAGGANRGGHRAAEAKPTTGGVDGPGGREVLRL